MMRSSGARRGDPRRDAALDFVAGECTKGIAQVMMQHDIPVAFGVLTVDTIEQAIERAGTKAGNKGWMPRSPSSRWLSPQEAKP